MVVKQNTGHADRGWWRGDRGAVIEGGLRDWDADVLRAPSNGMIASCGRRTAAILLALAGAMFYAAAARPHRSLKRALSQSWRSTWRRTFP